MILSVVVHIGSVKTRLLKYKCMIDDLTLRSLTILSLTEAL